MIVCNKYPFHVSIRVFRKRANSSSTVSVIYNLYLNLGVIGLRSLENYNVEDNVSPLRPHTPQEAKKEMGSSPRQSPLRHVPHPPFLPL